MKISKFVDLFIPFSLAHVEYWNLDEDPNNPLWSGLITNTPYFLIKNYEFDVVEGDEWSPVDLSTRTNEYNVEMPTLIVNIREKKEPK